MHKAISIKLKGEILNNESLLPSHLFRLPVRLFTQKCNRFVIFIIIKVVFFTISIKKINNRYYYAPRNVFKLHEIAHFSILQK